MNFTGIFYSDVYIFSCGTSELENEGTPKENVQEEPLSISTCFGQNDQPQAQRLCLSECVTLSSHSWIIDLILCLCQVCQFSPTVKLYFNFHFSSTVN